MNKQRVLISRDFYNDIIVIKIVTNDIMSLKRRKMTWFAQKIDFHTESLLNFIIYKNCQITKYIANLC